MDRFAICEGYNVAMLEWGHYARLTRLQRWGFRTRQDTHKSLIGDVDAHRAYHYASRAYRIAHTAGHFDPYDARGPLAQAD